MEFTATTDFSVMYVSVADQQEKRTESTATIRFSADDVEQAKEVFQLMRDALVFSFAGQLREIRMSGWVLTPTQRTVIRALKSK